MFLHSAELIGKLGFVVYSLTLPILKSRIREIGDHGETFAHRNLRNDGPTLVEMKLVAFSRTWSAASMHIRVAAIGGSLRNEMDFIPDI
jgi:hypothetical protein